MSPRPKTLNQKVLFGVVGTIAVLFFLACSLYAIVSYSRGMAALQKQGSELAETFQASNLEALLGKDYPFIETSARLFQKNTPDVLWIEIKNKEGASVVLAGAKAPGGNTIIVERPWIYHDASLGGLEIGLSTEGKRRDILNYAAFILLLGLATIAITGLGLTMLLKRLVLSPVEDLHEAVSRFQSGDLDFRMAVAGGDELEDLAAGLNEMARALQESRSALQAERNSLAVKVEERTRDLTSSLEKLKSAQNMLIRAQAQAMQAERFATLGQIAASMGHELRNPLASIQNALFYIKESAQEDRLVERDPQLSDILQHAEFEIHSATAIIVDLFDFTTSVKLALEPIRINELLEGLKKSAPRSIRFKESFDPSIPRVFADRLKIHRAFQSIVTNAIQAMPEGGTITLSSKLEGVPSSMDARVVVSIEDTGPGISPDIMGRIYEPLFSTKAKGVGLGLAICRSIVEAHGGMIEVQSPPGRGARFTISLPMSGPNLQSLPINR